MDSLADMKNIITVMAIFAAYMQHAHFDVIFTNIHLLPIGPKGLSVPGQKLGGQISLLLLTMDRLVRVGSCVRHLMKETWRNC
jgi:hypothetical protein